MHAKASKAKAAPAEPRHWHFQPDRAAQLVMTDCEQTFPLERLINTHVLIAWCLSGGTFKTTRFATTLALHLTLTVTKRASRLTAGADPVFLPKRFSFRSLPDRMRMIWYQDFSDAFLRSIPDLSGATDALPLSSYNIILSRHLQEMRHALAIAHYLERAVAHDPVLVKSRRRIQDAMMRNVLDLPPDFFRPAGASRSSANSILAEKTFDKIWDSAPPTLVAAHFILRALEDFGAIKDDGSLSLYNSRAKVISFQHSDGPEMKALRQALAGYRDVTDCCSENATLDKFKQWQCFYVAPEGESRLRSFSERQLKRLKTKARAIEPS